MTSKQIGWAALLLTLVLILGGCSDPSSPREPDPLAGPFTATVVSGGGQQAQVAQTLQPVVLEVHGLAGLPAAGLTLLWLASAPDGTIYDVTLSTTDARGRLSHGWTLSRRAGPHSLRLAHVSATDTTFLATVTAAAIAGAPTAGEIEGPPIIGLHTGDAISPPIVVVDRFGNAADGSALVWTTTQPLVATVNAGVLRARAEGLATLVAIVGSDTMTIDVVVHDPGSSAILQIAFGSCNDEDLPQPLWPHIMETRPDLWIWLGDNIYGDTENMSVLAAKYQKQRSNPGYQALLATTPVIATWDDHDYGRNNAGREYPYRAESQQLFLDFFDVPDQDPRRTREGVYSSATYGAAGQRVKVILLDVRYHREFPGPTSDVLGEAQWAWLERELSESDAQVNIIASGIQIVAEDHRYEKWSNFPAARERLFRTIGSSGATGVLLMSGDRHLGEIARIDGTAAGMPLYDITSSGLTHSFTTSPEEYNRHRVAGLMRDLHFGLLRFDWIAGTVTMQLRDIDNRVAFEQTVHLSELSQ